MIKDYAKEFKNLTSNKFSIDQSINQFYGLLFNFVCDREVFKTNDKIKEFSEDVLKKEYKDYLFRSRPYLLSRILNDIRKEKEYSDVLVLIDRILDYLNENYKLSTEIQKKKSTLKFDENISGWLNMKGQNKDDN